MTLEILLVKLSISREHPRLTQPLALRLGSNVALGERAQRTTGIPRGDLCYVLSLFSHVRLFVTAWTVARQAPLSMGFPQARILEWVAISFSIQL